MAEDGTFDQPPQPVPTTTTGSAKRQSSSSSAAAAAAGNSKRRSSSDAPNKSTTNDHGRWTLDQKLRSVLSHRLGLPLLYAFHNDNLAQLAYLNPSGKSSTPPPSSPSSPPSPSPAFSFVPSEGLAGIFAAAYSEAVASGSSSRFETALTEQLAKAITNNGEISPTFSAKKEVNLKKEASSDSFGRIDIVLHHKEEPEPYVVFEFGLHSDDWFRKLDQGFKYLNRMCDPKNCLSKEMVFAKPLLLAIVTITKTGPDHIDFRMGVFLCSRKQNADYRVTLLFRHRSTTLPDASNAFGRLLQVALLFFKWRNNKPAEDSNDDDYEYLSSNCCRVKVKHGGKEMVRIVGCFAIF